MVEAVAAIGVGLALFYVWYTHLSAAKFLALLAGIFMLVRSDQKAEPNSSRDAAMLQCDEQHL